MSDRRELISKLLTGPAAAAKAPCEAGSRLRSKYFPDVVVRTHDGRRALFYSDLIEGKIVIVNFVSTRSQAAARVTDNLAKVQRLLADRVGRDIFMCSITTDAAHDTPEALRDFAARHGVGPGWTFVTGDPADLQKLRGRLFVAPGHARRSGHDCSVGMVRYGNEAQSIWGAFPGDSRPELIAQRFTWVGFRREPAAV